MTGTARHSALGGDCIARTYPNAVNLGEIGDAKHQGEGFRSDHNPFIRHNGNRYVRAIDIGGDESIQQGLFNFVQGLYERRDARVYPFGYVHKDGVITTWGGGGTHADPGDDGHLHISVTQHDGHNPSPDGWVPALGFAPKTPSWADGTFGAQTKDAVAKWQRARWAEQTTRFDEVWSDDWRRLFA